MSENAKLAGNTSTETEQQNTPILSDHFDGFQSCTPFPQMAKLLGFLLQVPDELDMCVLERACWCAGAGHYCQRAVCILTTWCCYRVLLPECGVRYKLRCWCRCREWLQDVHGSLDVAPWWRLGVCCSKKGEHLVATKNFFCYLGPMLAYSCASNKK